MNPRRGFLLIAAAALLFQCAVRQFDEPLARGGGIEVIALDPTSKPLSGVFVSIRRSDYIDTGSNAIGTNSAIIISDATTDAQGKYSIHCDATGDFTVEVYDKKGNAAIDHCSISDEDSFHIPLTLRPTGTVKGRILQPENVNATRFFVYVVGLARQALTDDSGNFTISDLPEGDHGITIIPQSPLYEVRVVNGISVTSGDTNDLAPFEAQRAVFGIFPGDSLIVRAILDSNGLQSIPVDSVVSTDSLWPYRVIGFSVRNLRHDELRFQRLTARIGELRRLRSLDASQNPIGTIPDEIEKLLELRELVLVNSHLKSLPPEIGKLVFLEKLTLSQNYLDSLPSEIGNCTALQYIDIKSNPVKTLPASFGNLHDLKQLDFSWNKFATFPSIELAHCLNLQYIDASFNYIDSIPLAITTLGSSSDHKFISIIQNHLCDKKMEQLPQDICDWLDKHSTETNWRINQDCTYICIPQEQ
jgi:HAMP domain-containing protein